MPRFCVEPRPYCLIRAQKQNPFFLARVATISLCKFRRRYFFFSPRLPASPPLETTTRASCHHRLVSHPATAVSSRLQPPPRETTTRALAPSRLASVHHHARPLPLSRPSLCLSASVLASLYHHANTFLLLPQLSRRGFL